MGAPILPESSTPIKFNQSLEKPGLTLEFTTRPERTHSPTLPLETDSTHSLPLKERMPPLLNRRDMLPELLPSRPREARLEELQRRPEPRHTTPSKLDLLLLSDTPKTDKVTTFQEIPARKKTNEKGDLRRSKTSVL